MAKTFTTKKKQFQKNPYKQGKFRPLNPTKYKGKQSDIVYRSKLELDVMRFFDKTESILEWGSEELVIPYVKPTTGRVHRYYTDFNIKVRESDGSIGKYVIEVKPYKKTLPPTKHGNKKQSTIIYESVEYAINNAKWDATRQWCAKHGYKFSILTEKEIAQYMR
jgi:hypothetical protein